MMTGVLIIVIVTKWRKTDVVTWAGQNEKLTKAKAQPLICSQTFFDEVNSYPSIIHFSVYNSKQKHIN